MGWHGVPWLLKGKGQRSASSCNLREGCVRKTPAVSKGCSWLQIPHSLCQHSASSRAEPRSSAGLEVPWLGSLAEGWRWQQGDVAKRSWWLSLLSLWQLNSGSRSAGTARSTICAFTPGHFAPLASVITPKPRVAPSEHSIPGLHSPAIRSQPGTSPARQCRVPGCSVPEVPGRGPGLAPGGQWQCHPQPR